MVEISSREIKEICLHFSPLDLKFILNWLLNFKIKLSSQQMEEL